METVALKVEIWSDIVCPWCYLGKRRFEAAVAAFDGDVEVTWRSFELDPHAPAIVPPSDEVSERRTQMTELAAQEGLEYHFERAHGGNTFDAHRLVHHAAANGQQDEAMERLMRAYFTEGVAIGDRDALTGLATELGLELPEGDEYADAVRADEELAQRIGIQGVPYFVLDRRYGVSGAQPAELLVQALEKACA
jgi:predicted DsbA family dithiol-disulfide isomerase